MIIRRKIFHNILLICGICSPFFYLLTDVIAGNLYKGYSFNEQAVSELFAIGAPTAHIVVTLFTLSSILLLFFSIGVWLSSDYSRVLHVLAVMIFANAINSLILWNFFPMHMRGAQPTFTDAMHGILAINPFVLISIILGAIHFKNWFRLYSIVTIVFLLIPAIMAFSYIPLVISNQPTPWLGFTERISQYAHQIWHAILAIVLLHHGKIKSSTIKISS